jgi:tetratricopeptide (TPR) repeat protein
MAFSMILVILLLTCAIASSGQSAAPQRAAELLEKGLEYTKANQFDKAIEMFEQSLKIHPNPAAYNNIGVSLTSLARLEEAIRYLKKAIELNEGSARLHRNLGNAYYRAGKLSEASAEYEEALRLTPDYVTACFEFGVVLADRGLYTEAFAVLEKATRLDPKNALAHYALGYAFFSAGQYKRAGPTVLQAVALDPDLGEARFLLAVTHLRLKQRDAALNEYRFLQTSNPALAGELYKILFADKIVFSR